MMICLAARQAGARVFLYIALMAGIGYAHAASVPTGFTDRPIVSGITSPSAMAVMPGGRVLITQQNGQVRIIKNDTLLTTPFYTVDTDFSEERGLLGVVADPGFATHQYVYLYYTAKTPTIHNRILRVTASGDVGVTGIERIILDLPTVPASTRWHMGGALRFGADGKLYVAVGDHEMPTTAQDLASPFG